MTTLALTIAETLRYRGKIGQWSWALHRVSGLGTLLFFILHVIDTSWSVFYPELYKEAIAIYQSPLFTVGEFALVACVVYHAVNGIRIGFLDARPHLWKYQERAAVWVMIITALILIPVLLLMGGHVVKIYQEGKPFDLALGNVVRSQLPFAGGIGVVIAIGLILSGLSAFIIPLTKGGGLQKRSTFDTLMWSYMRVSGLLIVPLVFGHLAMMHVIQGVFDITKAGHIPVGGLVANLSGTAPEFVNIRWNTMFAGVMIWRIYDVLLLVLVAIHAFNGLRYVVNDYAHHPLINRGLRLAILIGAVVIIVVGAAAILSTAPATTNDLLNQTSQVITSSTR